MTRTEKYKELRDELKRESDFIKGIVEHYSYMIESVDELDKIINQSVEVEICE